MGDLAVGESSGRLTRQKTDDPGAVALTLARNERVSLVELLHRYGRRSPTSTITVPADGLTAGP